MYQFLLVILLISNLANGQQLQKLPLVEFIRHPMSKKPFIIYLSGDGGVNDFSKEFTRQWDSLGYNVVILNSLKYFWDKKTPGQAAADIALLCSKYEALAQSKFILMGYSFGADVLAFIYNNLNNYQRNQIKHIILLSPSPTTDFQIHLMDMMGKKNERALNVSSEIEKITDKPILVINADKEADKIDDSKMRSPNIKTIMLKGNHRFDGKVKELVNMISRNL